MIRIRKRLFILLLLSMVPVVAAPVYTVIDENAICSRKAMMTVLKYAVVRKSSFNGLRYIEEIKKDECFLQDEIDALKHENYISGIYVDPSNKKVELILLFSNNSQDLLAYFGRDKRVLN